MEFGAHLPLISFAGERRSLAELQAFTEAARDLEYRYLCANDHMLFQRPWLDGPTALAAVLDRSGDMTLATTVALPVVRGLVPAAKTLAALDILSGGRLVVGVGPGSSARDYEAVGLPFEERWKRLDEIVAALRAVWRAGGEPFAGTFYDTEGMALEPHPEQPGGPPIWIGSWGSAAGIRRVARLADGWLASGYNITPAGFEAALDSLRERLAGAGRDAASFPNGLATLWTYVTDDEAEAERVLAEIVAPMLNRPLDELRAQLPIGPPEVCAELLGAYASAGVQRAFLWPVADEVQQLERFRERVAPLVGGDRS